MTLEVPDHALRPPKSVLWARTKEDVTVICVTVPPDDHGVAGVSTYRRVIIGLVDLIISAANIEEFVPMLVGVLPGLDVGSVQALAVHQSIQRLSGFHSMVEKNWMTLIHVEGDFGNAYVMGIHDNEDEAISDMERATKELERGRLGSLKGYGNDDPMFSPAQIGGKILVFREPHLPAGENQKSLN